MPVLGCQSLVSTSLRAETGAGGEKPM